jgi:Secretion system C-terminal sorting domain
LKNFILTLFSAFICAPSFAQAPPIEWKKNYGGTETENVTAIQKTSDGGYVTAGFSYSNNGGVTGNHGGYDYWVVKMDDTGGVQWQKSYGGTGTDQCSWIEQTTDGGYIVCGTSNSLDGQVTGKHIGNDWWVVKLDDTGGIQWQKCLGGDNEDDALFIQQTTDGGYIAAGMTGSSNGDITNALGGYDYWVVKLSSTGSIQWQKTLGGGSNDIAYAVRQAKDGGYMVAGGSSSSGGMVGGSHGGFDYWLVKLDDTGGIKWQKCYGGSSNEFALSLQQTADGGYVAAGYSVSSDGDVTVNHGNQDYWVLKVNDTGKLQWQLAVGGSGQDDAQSVEETSDGGCIVTGFTNSTDGDVVGNHGDFDVWMVKISATGGLTWKKTLGGSGTDKAYCIHQTEGGYIFAATSNSSDGDLDTCHGASDYWVVKMKCNLTITATTGPDSVCIGDTLNLANATADGVWSSATGKSTIVGNVIKGSIAGADTIIYTFTNTCGSISTSHPITVVACPKAVKNINNNSTVSIVPNPTTGIISVVGMKNADIKVYTAAGRLIKEKNDTTGISIMELPKGIYFVRIFNKQGEVVMMEKVVKK